MRNRQCLSQVAYPTFVPLDGDFGATRGASRCGTIPFVSDEQGTIRILVCGDRNWTDGTMIYLALKDAVAKARGKVVVVHGACRGADKLGGMAARKLGLEVEEYPAQWEKYGSPQAGPIRNKQMLDSGLDRVLAFHHNLEESKGTKGMIKIATKAGVPVDVFG